MQTNHPRLAAAQAQAQSPTLDEFTGAFGSQTVFFQYGPPATSWPESTVAAALSALRTMRRGRKAACGSPA